MHPPPSVPQAAADGVVQEPFEQHPVAHEVESQTQLPPEQCRPVAHSVAPPHVQTPDEHPSARVASQDWHTEPLVPHAGPVAGDVHTLPVQHPF